MTIVLVATMKAYLLIASAVLPFSEAGSSSSSNRDPNTYGSFSNPNVAYSHYWANANNVLQDLSAFKKLYVKYHGCAWSTTSLSIGGAEEESGDDYYGYGSDVDQGCTGRSNQQQKNYYYNADGQKVYYNKYYYNAKGQKVYYYSKDNNDDQNNGQNDDMNNSNQENYYSNNKNDQKQENNNQYYQYQEDNNQNGQNQENNNQNNQNQENSNQNDQNQENNNQNDQNQENNNKYYQNQENNNQNDQNQENNNQNDQNQENNNQNDQNQENNNQNDQNQDKNDSERKKRRFLEDGDDGNACGNKSNSCDQWWQGMGSCYGANVAFSLYGILPGDVASTFNPCNRGTFINSFFTMDGLQSFVKASNGKVDISSLSEQCNGGMSTSCSADGKFVVDSFNGGCYAKNYLATLDTLDSLNKALESSMNCALIYSSGDTNYASDILSQSQQCSFDMKSCPDPYRLVKKYELNFAMAQRYAKYKLGDIKMERIIDALSALVFTGLGAMLLFHRLRSSKEKGAQDFVASRYFVSA